jgi:hypothetical protein
MCQTENEVLVIHEKEFTMKINRVGADLAVTTAVILPKQTLRIRLPETTYDPI